MKPTIWKNLSPFTKIVVLFFIAEISLFWISFFVGYGYILYMNIVLQKTNTLTQQDLSILYSFSELLFIPEELRSGKGYRLNFLGDIYFIAFAFSKILILFGLYKIFSKKTIEQLSSNNLHIKNNTVSSILTGGLTLMIIQDLFIISYGYFNTVSLLSASILVASLIYIIIKIRQTEKSIITMERPL